MQLAAALAVMVAAAVAAASDRTQRSALAAAVAAASAAARACSILPAHVTAARDCSVFGVAAGTADTESSRSCSQGARSDAVRQGHTNGQTDNERQLAAHAQQGQLSSRRARLLPADRSNERALNYKYIGVCR